MLDQFLAEFAARINQQPLEPQAWSVAEISMSGSSDGETATLKAVLKIQLLVDGKWIKVPQTGRVVIGNDVEIGAGTTIDCGALDDTVIADGVKLDNQIQIGHNVRIGAHTAMAGCVGVAGSTVIGQHCTFGGGAIVLGHLVIADDVHVTAASLVTKSIDTAGRYGASLPASAHREWLKNAAHLRHLDRMEARIRALETALKIRPESIRETML